MEFRVFSSASPRRLRWFSAALALLCSVATIIAVRKSSRAPLDSVSKNAVKPHLNTQSSHDALQSVATNGISPSSLSVAVSGAYARLPLAFEPNHGQSQPSVVYFTRAQGYAAFFTPDETIFILGHSSKIMAKPGNDGLRGSSKSTPSPGILRMRILGSNSAAAFTAADELPGKSNYLYGRDARNWRTGIANYRRISRKDIYPGIDLIYHGTQRRLEYDFVVSPGVDTQVIRLQMDGATTMHVNADGELVAALSGGEVRFHKPIAYQNSVSGRQLVAASYVLDAGEVGFHLGNFDKGRALVIDPILEYSTYIGGSNIDGANAIAVAADKTAFITGGTFSSDFPVAHPLQPNHNGPDDFSRDAFVSKISADGSALLYSTYLGGIKDDVANGIAVDTFGNAYVTGTTHSADFPVTAGSFNGLCGGDGKCGTSFNTGGLIVSNAFVSKLNPAGTALVYSAFIGEYENVKGQAIAVDANQVAYVTGQTEPNGVPTVTITPPNAPPPPFPITATAAQPTIGGATDAFLAKISVTGSTIAYSTYIGGSNEDIGYGIAVDANANAYVTGLTYSTDYPTTATALQKVSGLAGDAFFAKVNTLASGPASLVYSTFLGGEGLDQGNAVAVDGNGAAYVAGITLSSTMGFSHPGGFQPTFNGQGDAFVAKLDPSGSGATLVYFTYLGGSLADAANGVAVDSLGNTYVTGSTVSSDFPTTAAVFQRIFGGGNADSFVAKLNPTGDTLIYSTYLGGSDTETGNGIAVDSSGSAYVAGQTCSLDFPVANPEQSSSGGNCDAFVSKISVLQGIILSPSGLVFPSLTVGATSQPLSVTLTNGDNAQTISVPPTISGANPSDFHLVGNTCGASLAPGIQCTFSITFTPGATGIRKAQLTITDSAPGSPHIVNLTGSTSGVQLSASTLDFGNQPLGVPTSPQSIQVTNTGTAALTISSVTASGDFKETDNCTPAPLQPNANCSISVTFTARAAGLSTGSLAINDNLPGSPQVVSLTGTGMQPDFSISASPAAASVAAGNPASFGLTLTSISSFSQAISLSCSGLPNGATCSVSPQSVTPTSSAPATASVSITTAARTMIPPLWRPHSAPPLGFVSLLLVWMVVLTILWLLHMQKRPSFAAAFAVLLFVALGLAACNGGTPSSGSTSGTPAGTYQIIVTASIGSVTHNTTLSLQVK
jgi:hypothetical protein